MRREWCGERGGLGGEVLYGSVFWLKDGCMKALLDNRPV